MSTLDKTRLPLEELEDRIDHRGEYSLKDKVKMPKVWWQEQEPLERIHNLDEVPFGYTSEEVRAEAVRCLQCVKRNCIGGCPVNIDIPEVIRLTSEGDFRGAIRKIKETNILPAITGRVCPQESQCQIKCVLSKSHKDVNLAIGIGKIEAFLADWEQEHGIEVPECTSPSGFKVAVVGSGPAGLTCAADLARMGHRVTVFEAFHKLGGVLNYGIPEFRLPKKIVKTEIDNIKKMGVDFETNVVVGQTVTIDELFQEEGFHAVFVGTGAGLPWFLGIAGEDLNGVYSANEYLTRANLMDAYHYGNGSDTPIADSRRVAVIGGGNTAMDAARTALRLGAEKVFLIYRRSEAEMPARIEEIEHAKEEGVVFYTLANPVEFIGNGNDHITGARLQKMQLGEADSSGRRKPVPVPGQYETLELDTAIVAIGNSPNPMIPRTTSNLDTDPHKGTILVDEQDMMTSRPGVFAGGDIVAGASTVILAMGQGRVAAKAIDRYLQINKNE